MNAKQIMEEGTSWTAVQARYALPILLLLAKTGQKLTYEDLDREIAQQNRRPVTPVLAVYGRVLEIIGRSLNQLSLEWQEEIPPLTILIFNKNSGNPSAGVNDFLKRYLSKSGGERLTNNNRRAMIERATNAVHNYGRWDEVVSYFGITLPGTLSESDPIDLPSPPAMLGGESDAHLALKEYVAAHPELFAKYGQFSVGQLEYRLLSGDQVDVLFQNEEMSLAVEVKTADAPPGELTRGLFQCVKYRAVLRAMSAVAGDLQNVQALMVTPQQPMPHHAAAARRLHVLWQTVSHK